jgi:hypothetical protein
MLSCVTLMFRAGVILRTRNHIAGFRRVVTLILSLERSMLNKAAYCMRHGRQVFINRSKFVHAEKALIRVAALYQGQAGSLRSGPEIS